ncbi:MAG TPA: biotin/lipoyl-containing protein [Terriglobia bacterium]
MPTRFHVALTAPLSPGKEESDASEHQLEIGTAFAGDQGEARCVVDGHDAGLADWARLGPGLYSILLEGRSFEVRVTGSTRPDGSSGTANGRRGAQDYTVRVGPESFRLTVRDPRSRRRTFDAAGSGGPKEIAAPMPGKIVKVLVQEGDKVTVGQGLLVMEAMKMQNELRAPRAGRIERIYAVENGGVETGAPLVRLG